MRDKKISRKALEQMCDLCREYYTLDVLDRRADELLQQRFEVAREIEEAGGPNWFSIENFVTSFFGNNGLENDIENEGIITMLKRMGWRITETEA